MRSMAIGEKTGNTGESATELIYARIAGLGDWRGETLGRMRKLIHEADPDVVEAWYHIALIRRERNQNAGALKALDEYLKHGGKDATYHRDALRLEDALRRQQ